MIFPFNASGDQPREILCDCCFRQACIAVYEIDDQGRPRFIAHWCIDHQHWWQRIIYRIHMAAKSD